MKTAKRCLPVVLMLSVLFTITAQAYSHTLDLDYSYDGYRVNFANTVTSNSIPGFIASMQVNLYVFEESVGTVICDQYNSEDNPSNNFLVSSWSTKTLKDGNYVNEGAGVVKYIPQLSGHDWDAFDSRTFSHSRSASMSLPRLEEFASRGYEIANTLGEIPSDYECIVNSGLRERLGSVEDYLDIKQQLNLTAGDTVPVYFLSSNGDNIIAVKQDMSGLNYKFNFYKDKEEKWVVVDEVETVQSNQVYFNELTLD